MNIRKLILIILAVLLVGIFTFYILTLNNRNFELKEIKIEAGSILSDDINEYLVKKVLIGKKKYVLDLSKVNNKLNGTYAYFISYNKIVKKANIIVIDTKNPEVKTKELYIEVGERIDLNDFILSYKDVNDAYGIRLKGSYSLDILNNPGDYTINLIVTDINDNSTECSSIVHVYEKNTLNELRENDLNYFYTSSKNSLDLNEIENKYYLKLSSAIDISDASYFIKDTSKDKLDEYISKNYKGYKYSNTEKVIVYNKYGYAIGFLYVLSINNKDNRIDVFLKSDSIN